MALHGFAKKYRADSEEEREHAMKLVEYQNKRGGRVVFQDVAKPERQEWDTALQAVEQTLEMERTVHRHLLELHKTADGHGDAQMTDWFGTPHHWQRTSVIFVSFKVNFTLILLS